MTLLVVGTREDVAGFALAGVEGLVCRTREEALQAMERAGDDVLVLVSPEFAPAVGPFSVVLPPRK
jgi:vacuolar-type H+-ATPase subunit F/Vma7